jgi:Ca-activated chloride channel family protein
MEAGRIFFADLWLAWFLLPVLALWASALLLLPRIRHARGRRERAAVRYPSVALVAAASGGPAALLRRAARGLRWLTVGLLLVAMFRPQTGRTSTEVNTEGIDIVLVMDTSGSMQALDLDVGERSIQRRRNRLQVAVEVVEKFVAGRPNDQLGLVVFGEHAFTQSPLTLDHRLLETFLDRLEIGMAGDATAIGEAVGIAVKRLQQSEAKSKVIVLLTDGRNNAGRLAPVTAAETAAAFGIKLYAIGAGSKGQAPFLVDTGFGRRLVYENVDIDDETLQRMADVSGGKYFRAEDEQALGEIYAEIDRLEKTEITMESFTEYDDRYEWLVAPALALLLLEIGLLGSRLRALP